MITKNIFSVFALWLKNSLSVVVGLEKSHYTELVVNEGSGKCVLQCKRARVLVEIVTLMRSGSNAEETRMSISRKVYHT